MFEEIFQYKLIYIFAINDDAHKGLLKIGDTTVKTSAAKKNLLPNCKILNLAARKRIAQFTNTAGIAGNLLYTELAGNFRDYDVHRVLLNSNVKKISPNDSTGREWFEISLDKAVAAIRAVKENRDNLSGMTAEKIFVPVIFRPEQEIAINMTVEKFQTENNFLWNAKMRFGKTLCALEVVRRMNFSKTIIITHRPVVNKSWFDDFNKIFGNNKNFRYGEKNNNPIEKLLNGNENFVYFASIQDLRGSEIVGGKFTKNENIFATDWDFVIVDEAHEGTQTILGDKVIENLVKENTKILALSGTPFNILRDYNENVFTWDYTMEQRAKFDWDKNNFGDSNPYDKLPAMKIFTYNLGEILNNNYVEPEDKAFNFREFFRTDGDKFIHEDDIQKFLCMLTSRRNKNFPYSTDEFRNYFRHSLWIVPGVKEGRALSKLLKKHLIFQFFEIVNVCGDGDSGEISDALQAVKTAIRENNYTITLSCGKLTAGVTVPEWTAVFMLAGSFSTSAASYLQTIFRVQSPCTVDGMQKEFCYVFDFAPDRTLKMIAESAAISAHAGKTNSADRNILGDFLNFCPVISMQGSEMKIFDTNKLLQQLKRAYADRAVQNGFDDINLYNDELLKLDKLDIKKFTDLKKIVGASKSQKKILTVEINAQGFTDEEYEKIRIAEKKSSRQLTPEEKSLLKAAQEKSKLKATAISILRQISIRMPLLIYGADIPIDEDFKIEMLLDIDDESWREFMPKGVTKDKFKDFIKYYDEDIFIAAGHKIRNLAQSADNLKPSERVQKIADLFATFKDPDKETVLTSWRVVNIHLNNSFDDNFFTHDKKFLEINSKTGLYPLLAAYKIFQNTLGDTENNFSLDKLQIIWDKIIRENIFVICKTPMAKKITRRTLCGFRNSAVNAHYFENLVSTLKFESDKFVKRIKNISTWQKGVGELKFDAVIGNPPYQISNPDNNFAPPVYHEFLQTAWKISDKVSLIHPARCLFNAGATPKDFNKKILSDPHIKIIKYFPVSRELFPNTDIKGGVVITYRDADKNFGAIDTFTPFLELNSIHKKVVLDNINFSPLNNIIYSQTNYRLTKKFHEDNPDAKNIISKGHQNDFSTALLNNFSELFFDEMPNDGHEYTKIIGRQNNERIYKYFRSDWITKPESHEKYKVFVPKSNGSGALGEVLSTPLVGLPLVGSTETFITVGAFDSESEARACMVYIKSKFARCMLGILKVTQDNTPATWAKVPLQDFTSASDIDWAGDIDNQMYAKYKLSDEEIEFIESHVRAMD